MNEMKRHRVFPTLDMFIDVKAKNDEEAGRGSEGPGGAALRLCHAELLFHPDVRDRTAHVGYILPV